MYSASEKVTKEKNVYRPLTISEIEKLNQNGNSAINWQDVVVREGFNPDKIKHCVFTGKVNIGLQNKMEVKCGSLFLHIGLYHSMIRSCHIGDNVAIHHVRYLNNYSIEDGALLFNIEELSADDDAVFGMGYERKSERHWLEISNENGGRKILPFPNMRPADAQLWSRYGISSDISTKLIQLADHDDKHNKPHRAIIGQNSVVKNSRTIFNVSLGGACFVSGVESIKNTTVYSNEDEPAKIEDGVILSNSVIGYANHIQRGVKADHIYTCRNVNLEYGLRIFHTFVSPNSTIACGEVANNLLLPFHEQHHNNSFLIASTLLGQSNIAAGATIGSNHNSRAADGEILAERGFWPGLCANFKHNSYFSHFSLIAKGNYDLELNIKLPFSLISVIPANNTVQIMPGYWFKYNMYGLARNSWKFMKRDRRKVKNQHIETNYLAPDTVESMLAGIAILLDAVNKSAAETWSIDDLDPKMDKEITVRLDGMVNKSQITVIKPIQGILLYRKMIEYFAAIQIVRFAESKNTKSTEVIIEQILNNNLETGAVKWVNLGGQIIAQNDLLTLLDNIRSGMIKSWSGVHERYDNIQKEYPAQNLEYALTCLKSIYDGKKIDRNIIVKVLEKAVDTAEELKTGAIASRQKDFADPFRKMLYSNDDEMNAVLTPIDKDQFLIEYKAEIDEWRLTTKSLIKKLNI